MSRTLNDALTDAIRDPECPVQYSPVFMEVKRTLGKQAAEIKRLRDYIWTLDGKTICTRTDGDTFIDEGFIRASDIVPVETNSADS